jgi:LytS/YehU family sensor histidine kinase
MEIESARFNDRFSFNIALQKIDYAKEILIPSLLLQPFIENAILHGVSNKENGNINVVFRSSKNTLYVHIIDNGVGVNISKLFNKNNHYQTDKHYFQSNICIKH